jgi:hypothetical protein
MYLSEGTDNAASFACEPPLGSISSFSDESVAFNVAINTSGYDGSSIEVLLWHEGPQGWGDLRLQPVPVQFIYRISVLVDMLIRFSLQPMKAPYALCDSTDF